MSALEDIRRLRLAKSRAVADIECWHGGTLKGDRGGIARCRRPHAASEAVNGRKPARQGRERASREAIDSERGVLGLIGQNKPAFPSFSFPESSY